MSVLQSKINGITIDVSIIIVNYNTKSLINNCLKSIFDLTIGIEFEVIIIDNASIDGSQQMLKEDFSQVNLIENKKNLGFGKANNLGAKIAMGKYLFFLNSDCILIENTVKAFYDFMEVNNADGSIGVIGSMLFDKTMNTNTSYQKFPTKTSEIKCLFIKLFNSYFHTNISLPKNYNYRLSKFNNEVEFISGADMFMLKNKFDEFKGFDERFFLFYEETDLQKRMSKIGLKRIILRNQKIIHLEGCSSKTISPSLISAILYRDSMYKYFRKHSSFILYNLFYVLITPLLILPLFSTNYSSKDKKDYRKMLLRRISEETNQ